MKPQTRTIRKSIVSALIAVSLGLAPLAAGAAPLAISETPLTVSTTVEPNVMLLMDNSGSMRNLVWAEGFDPETSYPDWSYGNHYYDAADGNNSLSDLEQGGCSVDWVEARNTSGTIKCLLLPNPEGNSTRYTGAYLSYLFETYANGTDLRNGGQIPTSTRMTVAANAVSSFVDNTSGMRFGLASFNSAMNGDPAPGGRIDTPCDSGDAHRTDVSDAIKELTAGTWTPVAETLYEITRYYRGMPSHYNSNTNYSSPIDYRCQKNFAIVVTDGLPTYDTTFPSDDPADVANTSASLPNWDGEAPTTTIAMYPNFPQYSDGFFDDPNCIANPDDCRQRFEGYSLYLDDIAKFAYDIDMKTSGQDVAGGSYEDPRFPQQNMRTYTIGFSIGNQMLEDAAEYGHGRYLQANNASQLTSALQSALSHVFTTSSSSSSVATNSTRLGTETRLYQARFSTLDWTGEVLSFSINSDGSTQTGEGYPRSSIPDAAERSIYTYNPDTPQGVEFQWTSGSTSLSTTQQSQLRNNNVDTEQRGIERLAYLRGDQSNEITTDAQGNSTGLFRPRNSLLGDIVNSDPHYVGTPDYRYHLLPSTEGEAYVTFRNSTSYRNRTPMLYVGANDGMLHAFNASTLVESFAYVPNGVFSKLSELTSPDYGHMYFVDGSPRSGDAYINGGWKTVLVGGLGAGGKSIFALDVTNPAGFDANKVLWEFSHANLGYTFSQPTIVRLYDGSWAAIFGNGYNSTGQADPTAQLFIVDLADGSLIRTIDTGAASGNTTGVVPAGQHNGLSTPTPVDIDGDRITDYVYAGDLYGNLWKFDLTDTDSTKWDVAIRTTGSVKAPRPLFRAVDASGNGQPITSRVEVGSHSQRGPDDLLRHRQIPGDR
jgi:type IV pilus assembly protein PilY1